MDDFWLEEETLGDSGWDTSEEPFTRSLKKKPLREKNSSGAYRHVPHSEKPPQVVAKRNARERRRVQAVNNAFVKLRNVVPIQNSRGKRISKVKTLLFAIDYIRALDRMLRDCDDSNYASHRQLDDFGWQRNFNDAPSNWNYCY